MEPALVELYQRLAVIEPGGYAAIALSAPEPAWDYDITQSLVLDDLKLFPRDGAFPVKLTVLPVGDSITYGYGSQYGNGYRLPLQYLIGNGSTTYNFIGNNKNGSSPQPYCECFPSFRISWIQEQMVYDNIMNAQPNLVLIHAGTNDNEFALTDPNAPIETYADSPRRLGNLIDYVLCRAPNAVVLVAILIQNKNDPNTTAAFNTAVPGVVAQRYMAGYKVRAVNMSAIGGSEMSDPLHPNDVGYNDMANRWYSAMKGIPSAWWTTNPLQPSGQTPQVETCARGQVSFSPALSGNVVMPGAHVSSDSGEPTATAGSTATAFLPRWSDDGVVWSGSGYSGAGVHFADLDGDGRADYLYVNPNTASVRAWLNKGENTWSPLQNGGEILWGTGNPDHVEFADLNGDKQTDYIVTSNGAFRILFGAGPNGNSWRFSESSLAEQQLNSIFTNTTIGNHVFGDMNGDGLADLAVINSNGVVDFYIQQGVLGTNNFSWQKCASRALAFDSMILTDFDGDGRADYLRMDADGGLSGWLNKPGGTCNITFVSINGGSTKSVAIGGVSSAGTASLADLNGDGKADYVVASNDVGAMHLYPNIGGFQVPDSTGIGGYGAAVRLADINGDGKDDYISITNDASVLVYTNGQQSGNTWIWNPLNFGSVILNGTSGVPRHSVHFADLNGDGLDDYIVIDDTTGSITYTLNLGHSDYHAWTWGNATTLQIGIGGIGAGIHFADLTGDGRAEMIYLDAHGSPYIWVNANSGSDLTKWTPINNGTSTPLNPSFNRSDITFADIDGDGLADYIHMDASSGAVTVWYNLYSPSAPLPNRNWPWSSTPAQIDAGHGYGGANLRFARIGRSDRADLVAVEEDNGALVKVWTSSCGKVVGHAGMFGNRTCGNAPLPVQTTAEAVVNS